jgi:hypothetical protein
MTHPHTHLSDEEVLRVIDGEPPVSETHIGRAIDCDTCSARVRDMQRVLADADALYRHDFAAIGSCDGRVRLERAMTAIEREHDVRPLGRSPVGRAAMVGVAASLLLAGGWIIAARQPAPAADAVVAANALPRPSLTPGAVSALTAAELCASERPSRVVTAATKRVVLMNYQMQHVDEGQYELDALVTPELGGTTAAENLWPQRYGTGVWNARVKDELELLLPRLVCDGRVDLAEAQRAIAADWIAAYKKYFATDRPLRAHRGPAIHDDDELIVETPALIARGY